MIKNMLVFVGITCYIALDVTAMESPNNTVIRHDVQTEVSTLSDFSQQIANNFYQELLSDLQGKNTNLKAFSFHVDWSALKNSIITGIGNIVELMENCLINYIKEQVEIIDSKIIAEIPIISEQIIRQINRVFHKN